MACGSRQYDSARARTQVAGSADWLFTQADAATRPLEQDFADLDFFRACVAALTARGHVVAVASFGQFEVIEAYLTRACPGIFGRSNISTPSSVGVPDGFSVPGGKTPQLEQLVAGLLLGDCMLPPTEPDRQRVVFLDDSRPNVEGALAAGYTRSYLVPRGGFTRAAWKALARAEDADLFPADLPS